MTRLQTIVVVAIVFAVGGRLVGLAWSVRLPDRLSVGDRIAAASLIQRQVFDPDAAVLLAPGNDALPGQAGKDDDFDGLTDNRSEMGAVGSDDLCLAPWNDGYQVALRSGEAVVISRGTFVTEGALSKAEADEVQATSGTGVLSRLLIRGRDGDVAWSRMVIGPSR